MRWIILAVVGTAMVVYGQQARPHSNTDKRNSATESNDTAHPTSQTVVVVNQQAARGQQNDHPAKPPGYLHELLLPPNIPNLALVLVGIGGIVIAICTLKAVEKQIAEMRRQGEVMFGQLRAMHEQITEISAQTDILERSVEVAKESADAAKVSADIVVGVSIPTLTIQEFTIGDARIVGNLAFFQLPKFTITVKNYGQTPAFLWSWTLKFTCEDLPEVPVYGGIASGIPLEKQVVASGEPFTLPELAFHRRDQLAIEDAQAVVEQRKPFWVYGYVCYGDIFGSPIRRLKFCQRLLNIFPGDQIFEWTELFFPAAYVGTDLYPTKQKHEPEKAN
jgi:hypothetical protein